MPTEIKVPELGELVVEATVGRWLKQQGDHVAPGDVLVEIETDKVNLEVGADREGILARIDQAQGQDVHVGDVLGVLDEVGAAPRPAESHPTEAQAGTSPRPEAQPTAAFAPGAIPSSGAPADSEKITPVARRMAEDHAVDLARVTASGSSGRVTKEDVQRYIDHQPAPAASTPAVIPPAPRPTPPPVNAVAVADRGVRPDARKDGREERVTLSRRRRTIARRLVDAQHAAAMLTTFNEVDTGAMMDIREHRKEAFKEKYGVSLGINSFFIKAAVGALKQFPHLNAEIDGDDMILKHYYDIGVAIGAEEGLVVPVLRDADRMSFADIEKGIKKFAQQSTAGTLSLEDLRGGTFTVTNGGIFGSMMSTPILNAPQVAILGLHKIQQRAMVVNGQIVARPMMYIALSYDHRIVDGREAVQFLVRIKDLIEDPTTLLLEG